MKRLLIQLGKVGKGVKCVILNCKEDAIRSLSRERISGTGLEVSSEAKRVYLCGTHYKVWKKMTKKDRDLDRVRYSP